MMTCLIKSNQQRVELRVLRGSNPFRLWMKCDQCLVLVCFTSCNEILQRTPFSTWNRVSFLKKRIRWTLKHLRSLDTVTATHSQQPSFLWVTSEVGCHDMQKSHAFSCYFKTILFLFFSPFNKGLWTTYQIIKQNTGDYVNILDTVVV